MQRRPRGTGRVYKRGGIFWIRYCVDGKYSYESSGSRIKGDAEALLRKRLDRPVDRKPTVNDLLDRLLEDYELRQRDVYKVASHLRPVRERLGHVRAADIDEETIERYQKARLSAVSRSTINRECQMLGQALNRLAYPKYIARPIRIRKLPEAAPRRDFFTPVDIQAILPYLPDYLRDYVLFAWHSGWRKGEVSGLTWDDVQGDEIHLWHDHSKNREPRVLVLTDELRALIERRQEARIPECPYIFHRRGQYIRDFRKAWTTALRLAECPKGVFHALRRSSARDRIRAGVHERVVMTVNGWKTRSVFDRYNITNTDDIRDALEKTERYRQARLSES